uniref:Uncharacterized protein n=1 Tax=Triticum urartu TaxID=4572 RepID=A0A8R7UK62_TRIUA
TSASVHLNVFLKYSTLAEELRVPGDDRGDIGAGEAEAGEEGDHGVGIGGGLEAGELAGGLGGLCPREAAGGEEVVLRSESGAWGNGDREEAVERGCGRGGRRRREEMGEDGASQPEHG